MSIIPADLDLPIKFKSYRENQFEISAKIAASEHYAYMLDAPTGSGKSLIAATVQRLLNKNILYIATTKQLQDQLIDDFPYAKVLKGRSNYPCLKYYNLWPTITAEACNQDKKEDCDRRDRCPYI